ncbi:hypothetical protein [Phenylobacterium sp.]|uniref:hypothetical protein n=1 Tax=Phenylobacterium sp. TaxID=1871053 RepID=UPI002ED99D84
MLRIELSELSAQELKRLLDSARARGQTALAEQLVAELEMRPGRAVDWNPIPAGYGAQMAFEPSFEPADEPHRPRRSGVMVATAVLAAFVSAGVTWGLSVPMTPHAAKEPIEPAPRAAVMLTSVAPVRPQSDLPAPAPVVDHVDVDGDEPVARLPRAPLPMARAAPAKASARAKRCHDLPTPAQRLTCGYPVLAAQDRQLRAAYDKALASGADRRELDRAQAVWRGESENIADRNALAERYQRRIREIEAASARPPPAPPPPAKPAPEDPPF